ncbi:DUF551 domain-containing protein [Escherichia marmotae]|nr:DUF551 domain-containing protein [Escherichia marmotae]MED9109803.1 DUF551 domain-containing protein [Escherichia marmotae]
MSTLTNDELFGEMLGRINHLDVRDDIECRAYEIAMASLAAEPVAWLHSDNGLGIPAITRSKNIADSWLSKGWYVQPLYIAKPVPVVPDARPSLNNGIVGFDEGWNACRAAMLNGAEPVSQTYKLNELSGNSPVTPDGWISCSERMPAQDDWILIYSKHGEYMAGQVQGEYVELSDGTLSWLGNALYWMPLSEPPQEVNRG